MARPTLAIALAFGATLALGTTTLPGPAAAGSAWQKPAVQECSLGPAEECNVEVACPADMPYVAAGGGGMPKAAPADHAVAMTMNLPIAKDKWRVRWRNLAREGNAEIKVAVRVKCSDNAAEAGW
jgi:hypothetical protein